MMKRLVNRPAGVVLGVSLIAVSLLIPVIVAARTVKIEILKSSPVSITWATISREGNDAVIHGIARFPTWVAFGKFAGHVDIDVVLSNGETITRHDVRLVPKRIPKIRGRKAFFVARLATDIREVTILRIKYQDATHDRTGQVRAKM